MQNFIPKMESKIPPHYSPDSVCTNHLPSGPPAADEMNHDEPSGSVERVAGRPSTPESFIKSKGNSGAPNLPHCSQKNASSKITRHAQLRLVQARRSFPTSSHALCLEPNSGKTRLAQDGIVETRGSRWCGGGSCVHIRIRSPSGRRIRARKDPGGPAREVSGNHNDLLEHPGLRVSTWVHFPS